MIMLLEALKTKAGNRGLLQPDQKIDTAKDFLLVRDMPNTRASSRAPQSFKDETWKDSFLTEEHAHREEFIKALGIMSNSRWVKFQVWKRGLVKRFSTKRLL